MSEFLLELYSEEIPAQLQISARKQLKQLFERSLEEEGIKYKECSFCSIIISFEGFRLIICLHNSEPIEPPPPVTHIEELYNPGSKSSLKDGTGSLPNKSSISIGLKESIRALPLQISSSVGICKIEKPFFCKEIIISLL